MVIVQANYLGYLEPEVLLLEVQELLWKSVSKLVFHVVTSCSLVVRSVDSSGYLGKPIAMQSQETICQS